MRQFLIICALMNFVFLETVSAQETQYTVLTPELVDAYREYALARQQLIRYRQVILPMKQQVLANASQQTKLELAVLNRRLADYQPFLAVGDYSPVRTAAENDLLTRNATAQRLRQIQEEEIALMRFRGETDELYQYDVLRAVMRIRAAQGLIAP